MERSLEGFQKQGYQYGDAVVSERELKQSPYYRHFLKPLDIRHGLGIPIWSDDKLNMAVASFHRGHGERGFDADDIALVGSVRPHMVNAYAIYRRLAKLEHRLGSLRASFERAPLGMLVLDEAGHVLEINARAEACLFADALATRGAHRRLRFFHPATQQAFEAALRRLTAPDAAPASLPLRSRTSRSALVALHLCRVPAGTISDFDGRARILAFVAELHREQRMQWAEGVLQIALHLSSAEARVALALLHHADPAAAASALGISLATVRTHVRAIHVKVGVKRNADLLLILDRLLGASP